MSARDQEQKYKKDKKYNKINQRLRQMEVVGKEKKLQKKDRINKKKEENFLTKKTENQKPKNKPD